jgi:long-chain acyl-CoA synthetase
MTTMTATTTNPIVPRRDEDARSDFVVEWVFEHAARAPEREALASPTTRVTYGALATRIRRFARRLADLGVVVGDSVVVALPATPGTAVASLGTQLVGAVSVEVARDAGPAVLETVLQKSRPKVVVVFGRDARVWGPLLATHAPTAHVVVLHDQAPNAAMLKALQRDSALHLREDGVIDDVEVTDEDALFPARCAQQDLDAPALILFTSGSTGTPCGVILTGRNLMANARQIVAYLDLHASDRAMLVLPLSYSYGRSVLHTHLLCGGSVFLDPRFMYPRVVVEAIASEGCTNFVGVPMTWELLRRQVDVASIALPTLRQVTQAGGALTPEGRAWVRANLPRATFFVMYGATEATARLSYVPPARSVEKDGSIGIAIPGVELRVVDDHGQPVPRGEMGNLVARGDNISPGYLDDAERQASTFKDGWLWTGDLAKEDADGFFFVVGRAKEMLKIGGHRVSPREIEEVVLRHPAVSEGLVCGVSDPVTGDAACAVVVCREGQTLDESELRRFCAQTLPPYKTPRHLRLVDALPRNENGKIRRADVAAATRAWLAGPTTPITAPKKPEG